MSPDENDPHGERLARARRSLIGLSVGDAFGERFFGPSGPGRISQRLMPAAPWGWTDDTAMAVSIVEELSANRAIDSASLAERFAERYRAEPVRGYGRGAHEILAAIGQGVPFAVAAAAAFDGQGSKGNGAAMRVPPIGAYFASDLDAVVHNARRSAAPTHAHPDGQAGAIAVAVAAAGAVRGETSLIDLAIAHTPSGPTLEGLLAARGLSDETTIGAAVETLGSGDRVISSDTVPFALFCADRYRGDFTEAMWSTVAGLGDRDTTCAIVGGIVALFGEHIDDAWVNAREPLP